eukprot:TRINITY_DN5431_c0_g1_i7.p1 TRINITY_DN5431_c0_g1~~TRINITY_DN5431_c0_g1_i7.p1  ORF type:complete len:429 (+),score=115.65 TRINITY_DN5431_c0_g1_i7:83-1369(+)
MDSALFFTDETQQTTHELPDHYSDAQVPYDETRPYNEYEEEPAQSNETSNYQEKELEEYNEDEREPEEYTNEQEQFPDEEPEEEDEGHEGTKKRKRATSLSDEGCEELEGEEYETVRQEVEELGEEVALERQFEKEVIDRVKREKASIYKKRRRRDDEVKDIQKVYSDKIEALAERMIDALQDDNNSIKRGEIALSKLKLLNEVVRYLQLRNPEDVQVDKNEQDVPIVNASFLKAIAKWLEPLPGGALPALSIREALLKNLDRVSVDETVLTQSRIGIVVMRLSKHKKELESNRRLCKKLISKWSRPIFQISSNYSELSSGSIPLPPSPMMQHQNQAIASQNNILDDEESQISQGLQNPRSGMYPRKSTFDFQQRPRYHEQQKKEKNKATSAKESVLREKIQLMAKKKGRPGNSVLGINRLPRMSDRG